MLGGIMDKTQEWINLSNKEFEDKKYKNNGKTTGYFKMANGLWFSLPTYDQYISEWGEFIKDDDTEFIDGFVDENGDTSITSAKLKDTSFVVKLEDWKSTIQEVLQNTPYELSSEEKRMILLEKIKQKTGNDKIESLIFDIKESQFQDIIEMYYSQEGEEIKEQKSARNFNVTEETFMHKIGENGLFFKDFETFKNNVLLKIEFLEKLQEMDETKKYTYNELYKYFNNEDKIEIEN